MEEMAMNVNVEVRRTVNTPKGRKFPPREPKVFTLTMAPMGQHNPGVAEDQYAELEGKVKQNFPGLQGKFMLHWKDSQGELLPCNNNDQLMQALDGMTNENLQLFVERKTNWQCNMMTLSQCSECHQDIKGLRTKCLQCPDYNLCTECDLKGLHDTHVMVRCARPRFFNFALPWFSAIIPQFCEEFLEKNKDKPVPRISPLDVRQFWQRQKKQAAGSDPDDSEKDGSDCQSKRGQNNKRKEMKRAWHGFLANIAVDGDAHDTSDRRSFQAHLKKHCPKFASPNQDSNADEETGNLAEKN